MILVLVLSLFIGLSLGLLGGGGSILAVPVLKYAAGLGAKEAIATSLLIVGTTAGVGAVQHARKGNIDLRTGVLFAVTAMAGAYGGGLAAHWFSGTTLLLLFAAMMLTTSVMMFRGRGDMTPREDDLPVSLVVIEGLVVGFATGLVGAGGGFMIVPALVLLGGMPIHRAVGTSLMVMTLKSYSAFAGYVSHVEVDYELAMYVTGCAVLGTVVGARFSQKVNPQDLRKGFAWFVLSMAAFVIAKEASPLMSAAVIIPAASWMGFKTMKNRQAE
jgi:uncharacterized protein